MKTMTYAIGVLLIVLGITAFAYQGFSYTKREKVAEIGALQITADTQKTVYFSPILGGAALIAGAALILIGRKIGK